MSSKELVRPAAQELIDDLLAQGRSAIDKRQVEMAKQERNKRIERHYYDMAEQTMKQLWRECKKRTGHQYTTDNKQDYNGVGDNRPQVCMVCAHPIGYRADDRKRRGITEVARQLRGADRDAGVEWIPFE